MVSDVRQLKVGARPLKANTNSIYEFPVSIPLLASVCMVHTPFIAYIVLSDVNVAVIVGDSILIMLKSRSGKM